MNYTENNRQNNTAALPAQGLASSQAKEQEKLLCAYVYGFVSRNNVCLCTSKSLWDCVSVCVCVYNACGKGREWAQ